jgi:hypothetical protein
MAAMALLINILAFSFVAINVGSNPSISILVLFLICVWYIAGISYHTAYKNYKIYKKNTTTVLLYHIPIVVSMIIYLKIE